MFTFPVGFFGGSTGGGDPYWSSVVLYLPLTGTNGQATFTDVSQYGHAVTRNGNTVISTAQAPALTGVSSSAYFDGTGDFLTIPDNSTWTLSADFTIECFIRFAGYAKNEAGTFEVCLAGTSVPGVNNAGYYIVFSGTASSFTTIKFGYSTNGNTHESEISSSSTFLLNTWYHVAVCRSANLLYMSVNGVITNPGGTSIIGSIFDVPQPLKIGALNYTETYKREMNGFLSHLRITKGVARYTANFTPPTAPFPIG